MQVFITYAHEAASSDKTVLNLADRLRKDGVDARIDAYEPHPSEGWPRWMENQLAKADKTIVVPSKTYLARYSQESGAGSGATFEASILRSKLLRNGVSFEKLAIGLLKRSDSDYVPDLLHGCPRYLIADDEGYEQLYRWLTEQPAIKAPKLGAIKALRQRSTNAAPIKTFKSLCQALKPLLDDNRRVFRDFGPNSSANSKAPVRYNLASWYRLRKAIILPNNEQIRALIVAHSSTIPIRLKAAFEKLESHIDAFEAHVADDTVDYREHQFPQEIENIVAKNI